MHHQEPLTVIIIVSFAVCVHKSHRVVVFSQLTGKIVGGICVNAKALVDGKPVLCVIKLSSSTA